MFSHKTERQSKFDWFNKSLDLKVDVLEHFDIDISQYSKETSVIGLSFNENFGSRYERKTFVLEKNGQFVEGKCTIPIARLPLEPFTKMEKNAEGKSLIFSIELWKEVDENYEDQFLGKKVSLKLFCCQNVKEYMVKIIDRERYFTNFFAKKSIDPFVMQVHKTKNNGPSVEKGFYVVENGEFVELPKDGDYADASSYKNYKCKKCNFHFALDLFKRGKSTSTKHHRRTKINFG